MQVVKIQVLKTIIAIILIDMFLFKKMYKQKRILYYGILIKKRLLTDSRTCS